MLLPAPLLLSNPRPVTAAQTATLRAPEGWREVTLKNGQTGFAPEDLPAGKVAAMVFWPVENAPGDLKAWFARRARDLGSKKGGEIVDVGGLLVTKGVADGLPYLAAAVRPSGFKEKARIGVLFADEDRLGTYAPAFLKLVADYGGISLNSDRPPKAPAASNADPMWTGLPASDPVKPLPAAEMNGAKVFVVTRQTFGMSGSVFSTYPLILFPDGTAFDSAPNRPVAAFDPAHVAPYVRSDDVGRWSVAGDRMTLTYPARREPTVSLRKVGEAWTDDADATEESAWNVVRRVLPGSAAKLQGRWSTSSIAVSGGAIGAGTTGGGGPMVASSSSGTIAFRGDRYSDSASSFASTTTNDTAVSASGGTKGTGRFRLDGLLLTREKDGRRGIELCFLLPGDPGAVWVGDRRYTRP